MKKYIFLKTVVLLLFVGVNQLSYAQTSQGMQYLRPSGFDGLNQFEPSKDEGQAFDGVKIRVGGDFSLQFQSISHSTENGDTLAELGSNFNLPTANLNIDAQLADGVRMNLVTYLSSRHHPEAWVKGGYVQIDKLDFIREGLLSNMMEFVTIKTGLDEINYGDAHFRRSDNARTFYNPFVGNYIMDAFTTEAFGEVYYQGNGMLVMLGLSNGTINQSVVKGTKEPKPSLYAKAGYDKEVSDELRVRLTGSVLNSPSYDNGQYLYSGDRAGARYYSVMRLHDASDNFRSGRFSPGFWKFTAMQINPFVKWKRAEFFGVYELVSGDQSETVTDGKYSQIGAELIYRLGNDENIYFGGRFNQVSGKDADGMETKTIQRINIGGGWMLTRQILLKTEYVIQTYSGDGWLGSVYQGGEFKGVVAEATISF